MKRGIFASSDVKTEVTQLAEDMLYQIWENDKETTLEDATQSVIEHIEMVVNEMDDDGVHKNIQKFASESNPQFVKLVTEYVKDHYDDYKWYVESSQSVEADAKPHPFVKDPAALASKIGDNLVDFLDWTSYCNNLSDYLDEYDMEHLQGAVDVLYDFAQSYATDNTETHRS